MIWEAMHTGNHFWINPWCASEIAENKGWQITLATSLGLKVPETLITSSREIATSFIKKMKDTGRKVVLKTITGFRNQESGERGGAFVTTIGEDEIGGQNYPLVLQEYIEKDYELRVTVVGEKVFSCKITSQDSPNVATKHDWRVYDFANVKFLPINLPINLEKKLIALNRLLGLNYSAIDMICEPDGSIRFLELNPNGLWLWIEELAGLPITNAIADLLINPPDK
jgi:glutathione synthase/RimK-type ligase-like ATP-grasp enzyme